MSATTVSAPAGAHVVLGRYVLDRRLGSGGFGTVWLAHDKRLGRPVAVKVVDADRVGAGGGGREALACARLSHPAIVTLYEAGEEGDSHLLVSEWVDGEPLDRLLADGVLSDRDVAQVGIALCDALAHAHARGVVHRDIKPANVLLPASHGPGAPAAKLTDFGIARVAGGDVLSRTGDVVGTLAYMAPEQAEGHRAGPAADLYALAVVLHEALAGVNPLRGATPAATVRRVGKPLPSLARARRDLPPEVCAAVDRASATVPGERGTLSELRDALADSLGSLTDEPGTVAPAWGERLGEDADGAAGGLAVPRGFLARRRARRGIADPEQLARPTAEWSLEDEEDAEWEEAGEGAFRPLAGRFAGAATTGGLAALGMAQDGGLDRVGSTGIATAATIAALFTLLAPRFGWLAVAAVAFGWTVAQEPGTALLLAAALAAPPLLFPRRPSLWSLPGVAPLLGAVGAVLVFPLLAVLIARTAYRRAALAACGLAWAALAEAAVGRPFGFGGPSPAGRPAAWREDPGLVVGRVLEPIAASSRPALVLAGAAVAVALPLAWRRIRRGALEPAVHAP